MKTTPYDKLEEVRDALAKCMKCGNCMAVCPVYVAEKQEAAYARGKIAIAEAILKGELDLKDEDVQEKLFNCLICTSCMQICPSGVDVCKIMLSLRAALAREEGLHPVKKMIFAALKNQSLFDKAMKTGAALQWMGLRKLPGNAGYEPRFTMGLAMKRIFPGLAKTPFRDSAPALIQAKNKKTKVSFFTGCAFNYIFPDVAWDVVEVLKENDVEIAVPKEQQCCGIAVFAHGDIDSARELARKNIDVMEKTGVDYIVTACGSCGESWQHGFKELLSEDPVYGPKAEYWKSRTYDISTFLTKVIDYKKPEGRVDASVTYHDPCHLKKVMKVFAEPRAILKSIPGVTLKEMAKPDACCGSGGSYTITHFDTSMAISGRKADDIRKTGADGVATGCPGCMMQLSEGLAKAGQDKTATHYISLLARSYREARKSRATDIKRNAGK
jgi:glycolate oxidase iron-sulfur subunit